MYVCLLKQTMSLHVTLDFDMHMIANFCICIVPPNAAQSRQLGLNARFGVKGGRETVNARKRNHSSVWALDFGAQVAFTQ